MSSELDSLLQPLVIDWRISELKKWAEDYGTDHTFEVGFSQLRPNGTINIYHAHGGGYGFEGKQQSNGQILLTPVIDEYARANPAAVEGLKQWLNALSMAVGLAPRKSKRGPRPRSIQEKIEALKAWDELDRDRFPTTLEDWLDDRFGNQGGKLNVKAPTFHGWRRYLKNS